MASRTRTKNKKLKIFFLIYIFLDKGFSQIKPNPRFQPWESDTHRVFLTVLTVLNEDVYFL